MQRAPFDERPTGNGYGIGVSQSTVANWLSRTLKEEKERKREKAFALWLACHTQEEIAEAVEVAQNTVTGWEKEFIEKLGTDNLINSPDFTPPIYNVWTFATIKKAGSRGQGGRQIKHNEPGYYCTKIVRVL